MSNSYSKSKTLLIGTSGSPDSAASIPTGATSGSIAMATNLGAVVRGKIVVPTGVTVAPVLRFYGSPDGVNYFQDGGDVAVPTAAGTYAFRYDPSPADRAVKVDLANGDAGTLQALFQLGSVDSIG